MNLVVMAAGMGSRFGGLKQLTPVGPNGEFLIDYSIYDAKKAGVNKVIFVIRKDMEELFKEKIINRLKDYINVTYVFQNLEDTPIKVGIKREKPWGTGQALLASAPEVDSNFMIINADDFYGRDAFLKLGNFLSTNKNPDKYAFVAYKLKNTLSTNGTVSRGICELSNNHLKKITECTKIESIKDKIVSHEETLRELSPDTLVSLNLFGFTKTIFNYTSNYFKEFLTTSKMLEKEEFYLSVVVQKVITDNLAEVEALSTTSSFQGMTYKEDLEGLKKHINNLIKEGIYPEKLWEDHYE